MLPELTLERPTSLAEAARLAARDGARILGGGTDLIPNLRHGLGAPRMLVSLERVAGLDRLERTDQSLHIGAGVTLARLARANELDGPYAAIREAASVVAGPAHRTVATLGGNLCLDTRCVYYNQSEWWRRANGYCLKHRGEVCHVAPQGKRCRAAFSGDLAPALMALGASASIAGADGVRRCALESLYRDDGAAHLALGGGEILASVEFAAPAPGTRSGYLKARARGAIDFPLAGVAMALRVEQSSIAALRVALTGTNPAPLLLSGTAALLGRAPDPQTAAALGKLVQKQAGPVRTTVTAADWRRQVAATYAQRLLRTLAP